MLCIARFWGGPLVRIRKILCPVDFFRASEAALVYAGSLAKNYEARIHILHVIPPASSFLSFAQDTGKLVKSAHDESRLRLTRIAKTVKASGVHPSVEVRFGEIDREIVNTIGEYKANLVVAGTHGRRGFQHWLIGSVCERLLRTAPIPILTIGHVRTFAGLPNIKRVLIGIDFSAGSTEAAAWGFSIAQKYQADVTLIHVADFVMGDIPDRYRNSLLEGIRLEMEKLIPAEASTRCAITTRVEFGIPFQLILKLAERGKDNLIVLGTHGKSMLDRTLLGSSTERVIRGASCPVLAVPPGQDENVIKPGGFRTPG